MKIRAAIIGGGAAGLAAACSLGINAETTVYEHSDRVGKKILITGAGRCNVMNEYMQPQKFICDDAEALNMTLSGCENRIKEFFALRGLVLRCEEEGRIYPLTNQAASVLDVLRFDAKEAGCEILCGAQIGKVEKKDGVFIVHDKVYGTKSYDAVILACGGKAAPKTGSDGSGFNIAVDFGHTVTKLSPALVPLKTTSNVTRALKGIRCKCKLTLKKDSKKVTDTSGEIQFTEYGISGIAAMQLSRYTEGKGNSVIIDFVEECSYSYILERINAAKNKKRELQDVLLGILPRRVAQQIIKTVTQMPLTQSSAELDDASAKKIAESVKAFKLDIEGTLSWDNAQVTRGGIPLREIDAKTMESKRCKGLYIVGEMLNCDGDCGGYNLGWAWITGIKAAEAVIGKGEP